jgi:hypothetical protein
MPTTNNIFSYSSNPLPVKPSNSRKKYKDDGNNFTLMSDPRVVRGMVRSSLKKSLPEKISKDTSSSSHRHNHGRNIDEKNEKRQFDEMHGSGSTHNSGHVTGMYSYNVSSIVQENIDVTQYLIEQESNKPIQKVHETQTDDFQERPLTPEYIPKKTGIDRSTQVENPADLFLFDEEVELIVSVIAAKTLEQSLYEIEQEVELTSLQQRIEYFHQQKLIENQWIKKREEESIADACIKDLALKGMKEKVTHENLVREKVAARQTMIQLLPKMVGEVIDELYEENIWVEPSKEFILKEMVPEMKRVVRTRAELYEHVTEILDGEPSLSLSLSLSSIPPCLCLPSLVLSSFFSSSLS